MQNLDESTFYRHDLNLKSGWISSSTSNSWLQYSHMAVKFKIMTQIWLSSLHSILSESM